MSLNASLLIAPLIDILTGKIIEAGTGGDHTKILARANELIAVNNALVEINAGNTAGLPALQAAFTTTALSPGEALALQSLLASLSTQISVLTNIAEAFCKYNTDIIYGDLDYINEKGRIVRKWRSGQFSRRKLEFGWMPPHPTFYCRRNLFERYGFYRLDYGTAADYELMSRYLYVNKLTVFYLNMVIIKMKLGGKSNKSIAARVKALFYDLKAMRNNGITLPFLALIVKPVRKITQYF